MESKPNPRFPVATSPFGFDYAARAPEGWCADEWPHAEGAADRRNQPITPLNRCRHTPLVDWSTTHGRDDLAR
jgi:hypothetical protein